ncbi:hypothetical protein GCM10010433_60630 [Streptomyces pulveraceus]
MTVFPVGVRSVVEGPAGECAEVDMDMTLAPAPAPVVLWEGTKNVNETCCEVTHKPRGHGAERVNRGRGDAQPG